MTCFFPKTKQSMRFEYTKKRYILADNKIGMMMIMWCFQTNNHAPTSMGILAGKDSNYAT